MKIYLVYHRLPYCESTVVGVFTDKVKAYDYRKELKETATSHENDIGTMFSVEEWEDGQMIM